MYGSLCWQGCENDHGGFKKLMWYAIMKEFNCKVTSTWSECKREKETAFTHQQFGDKGKERTAELDYIVGPRRKSDKTYIYNDVKIWDSWDHHPIRAVIQEHEEMIYISEKKRTKKWTGWRPKNDEERIEVQKAVMEKGDEPPECNLISTQQEIEKAQSKVAHA